MKKPTILLTGVALAATLPLTALAQDKEPVKIALVTSKGAHGVPGSAIVVLAATLHAIPAIPAIADIGAATSTTANGDGD